VGEESETPYFIPWGGRTLKASTFCINRLKLYGLCLFIEMVHTIIVQSALMVRLEIDMWCIEWVETVLSQVDGVASSHSILKALCG
jgi:hypothetical protein